MEIYNVRLLFLIERRPYALVPHIRFITIINIIILCIAEAPTYNNIMCFERAIGWRSVGTGRQVCSRYP